MAHRETITIPPDVVTIPAFPTDPPDYVTLSVPHDGSTWSPNTFSQPKPTNLPPNSSPSTQSPIPASLSVSTKIITASATAPVRSSSPSSPPSSSLSSSLTRLTTTSLIPPPTPTTSPNGRSSSTTIIILGIVIGIVAILVFSVFIFLYLRRRRDTDIRPEPFINKQDLVPQARFPTQNDPHFKHPAAPEPLDTNGALSPEDIREDVETVANSTDSLLIHGRADQPTYRTKLTETQQELPVMRQHLPSPTTAQRFVVHQDSGVRLHQQPLVIDIPPEYTPV